MDWILGMDGLILLILNYLFKLYHLNPFFSLLDQFKSNDTFVTRTHHGHNGPDSLAGRLLPAGRVNEAGAEVGHVEGDTLQHTVRSLAALLLQLCKNNSIKEYLYIYNKRIFFKQRFSYYVS